uniref:Alkane hydroxylase MAH1 n=1 Tax=Ananas comosus var. bracteatus TaxID=296719 RepID=A0A6V7NKB7_ANACO|nr:unnamed protein product [Ananas comosus var. bracteatus]
MDAFVDETIAARRKQVEAMKEGEAVEQADLLTTYMLQSVGNRNSVEFVEFDGFLQANAKNLLLAGRDTTAATLTWFFWLLSKNPDVEEAIVEELKANWPRPASEESTPFDREALGKLVYLHAALCECLRLYPPVAIQHKGVSRADVLPSGHAVRPGTMLIFHLYSMGRMEGIWGEDCMEFRPERWIVPGGGSGSGREIKHEPAHKFFAFNCGPRSCLGKEMAFNTMKTVVAAMLYNFHVEVVEGHVVEPKLTIILHMKYGLMVRIKKRDKISFFTSITSTCTSLLLLLIPFLSFLFLHLRRVNRLSILPVNWPVLGMLPSASVHLHHLHDHIVHVFAATRWSFAFHWPWLLRMDMLFTCDPGNVNHVFTTHSAIYPKGRTLPTSPCQPRQGGEWPHPLLRHLAESNAAVDLQDVFLRLTFDTTCTLVLGVDPGCLSDGFPTVPFAKALDDASEAIFFRHVVPKIVWKVLKWLEIGRERKLAAVARVMDAFVDETIAARRKQVEVAKEGEMIEPADLLTTYMLQSVGNQNSVEFVEFDGFLQANAKNLLLAGRDTTAVTLTWFFWLLSKNPDVEEAIVEELKANWPRPASEESTPFDRAALGKLVYLHAALCECLRLYPPVAIQHKGVSRVDVLPSVHAVRPGTILIFHLYSMGRMEGYRGRIAWSSGQSGGLCRRAAAAQRGGGGHVVEPKLAIILHMKYGLMVRIKKRDKSAW